MSSRVRFRNESSGEEREVVLGLSVGDSIEWPLPGGRATRPTVTEIPDQPEAAGDPV